MFRAESQAQQNQSVDAGLGVPGNRAISRFRDRFSNSPWLPFPDSPIRHLATNFPQPKSPKTLTTRILLINNPTDFSQDNNSVLEHQVMSGTVTMMVLK
jgi:hypothetical protein